VGLIRGTRDWLARNVALAGQVAALRRDVADLTAATTELSAAIAPRRLSPEVRRRSLGLFAAMTLATFALAGVAAWGTSVSDRGEALASKSYARSESLYDQAQEASMSAALSSSTILTHTLLVSGQIRMVEPGSKDHEYLMTILDSLEGQSEVIEIDFDHADALRLDADVTAKEAAKFERDANGKRLYYEMCGIAAAALLGALLGAGATMVFDVLIGRP